MKKYSLAYLIFAVFILVSCEEKEDPIPKEESFNYYFKFEAEGKSYFFGFDEIVDQLNPYEVYNGKRTQNFIVVGSSSIFTKFDEFCGQEENRDCISATFMFNARSVGTFQAQEIGSITGNEFGDYVRFLTSDMEQGNLSITITKADPVNRIMEATFSGRLYNRFTNSPTLIPISGEFRAYYNPS